MQIRIYNEYTALIMNHMFYNLHVSSEIWLEIKKASTKPVLKGAAKSGSKSLWVRAMGIFTMIQEFLQQYLEICKTIRQKHPNLLTSTDACSQSHDVRLNLNRANFTNWQGSSEQPCLTHIMTASVCWNLFQYIKLACSRDLGHHKALHLPGLHPSRIHQVGESHGPKASPGWETGFDKGWIGLAFATPTGCQSIVKDEKTSTQDSTKNGVLTLCFPNKSCVWYKCHPSEDRQQNIHWRSWVWDCKQ